MCNLGSPFVRQKTAEKNAERIFTCRHSSGESDSSDDGNSRKVASAVRENLGESCSCCAQLDLKGLDQQGALSARTGFVHLELLIPSLIR